MRACDPALFLFFSTTLCRPPLLKKQPRSGHWQNNGLRSAESVPNSLSDADALCHACVRSDNLTLFSWNVRPQLKQSWPPRKTTQRTWMLQLKKSAEFGVKNVHNIAADRELLQQFPVAVRMVVIPMELRETSIMWPRHRFQLTGPMSQPPTAIRNNNLMGHHRFLKATMLSSAATQVTTKKTPGVRNQSIGETLSGTTLMAMMRKHHTPHNEPLVPKNQCQSIPECELSISSAQSFFFFFFFFLLWGLSCRG